MPVESKPSTPTLAAKTAAGTQFTLRQLFFSLTIIGLYCATIVWFGPGMLWLVPLLVIVLLRCHRLIRTLDAVVLTFVLLVLGACVLPAVQDVRTPSLRASCGNRLKMISIALQAYHHEHGCYPSPVIYHTNGRPMHSWRILIASYIERDDLRDAYDMSEPWDGPTNSYYHDRRVRLFECPGDAAAKGGNISYLAVILPNAKPGDPFPVIEVPNSGVNFFEPRDVILADLLPGANGKPKLTIMPIHSGPTSVHVLWPDGNLELIPVAELPARLQGFNPELPHDSSERPARQ